MRDDVPLTERRSRRFRGTIGTRKVPAVQYDDVTVAFTGSPSGTLCRAVVALGSNLGDQSATMLAAVSTLAAHDDMELVAMSSLHETVAPRITGPDEDAPRYLKAIAILQTTLKPHPLIALLQGIEARLGRTREVTWGDRTLDLDLIDVQGIELDTPALRLPHTRAAERDFVLIPRLEVDPAAQLTGYGSVRRLLEELNPLVPFAET